MDAAVAAHPLVVIGSGVRRVKSAIIGAALAARKAVGVIPPVG